MCTLSSLVQLHVVCIVSINRSGRRDLGHFIYYCLYSMDCTVDPNDDRSKLCHEILNVSSLFFFFLFPDPLLKNCRFPVEQQFDPVNDVPP